MILYDRQWNLNILTWRGDTININQDLSIIFNIHKNISQIYQFAEITIYNLNPDTETDIFENAKEVTLEAGYKNGPYGVIFKGPVRQPIRGKEDAVTFFLKLICIDGDDALNLGFCNFTLASGQTAVQIAKQIVRNSSIPFDVSIENDNFQATSRGKVVFGNPGDYLRDIASQHNSNFYMDDGQAKIVPLSKSPPLIVPELNADTGMIGFPHQTDQGIEVQTLLRPDIKLDSWVKLNNQDIIQAQLEIGQLQTLLDLDGLYRVIEIYASGSSRGNDWLYDLTCISQTGILPLLLSDQSQTGL